MNTRFGVAKLIGASESTRTIMWVIGAAAATFLIVLPVLSSIPELRWYGDFYSMFWWSLLAIAALVAVPAIGQPAAGLLNSLASLLHARGSFRSDALAEAPKFAIIRILFGLFMLERSIWVIVYMFPSDWDSPLLVLTVFVSFAASAMVFLGLFTQVALAYLVLIQWQIGDSIMGTMTLGNDIAAMLSVLMIFSNAGAHYSLDARLRKRPGFLGKAVAATYYESGIPSNNTLQIAKFLTLMAYWCVCVYSLAQHIDEPAWTNGSAGPLLLSNNFMSRYFAELTAFFELGSWAVVVGKIALWAMLPWYLTVLPCVVLGGWLRTYVIAWGILFFALSLLVLQLGWLAHFEFLLFAGLFWQSAFMRPRGSLKVAYDDRCNLCDRTVNFVKRVDIFGRVELKPVSENADWLAQNGIRPDDAMTDLYGVEADANNRKTSGYDIYVTLARTIFLLLPFFPILVLGKWLGIGPLIYRYIADRRTRLFGVCQIPTKKPDASIRASSADTRSELSPADPVTPLAAHMIVLALAYLMMMPAPSIGWAGVPLPRPLKGLAIDAAAAAHFYGITPIDVFNETDLRMAENWFTLTFISEGGERTVVPILGEKGERLAMHASDRVYFGHTVTFRRMQIGKSGCFFTDYEEMLGKFAQYYRAANGGAGGRFLYAQYFQPLPDVEQIVAGSYAPNEVQQVCSREFRLE